MGKVNAYTNIRMVRGSGVNSVQVWTESIPGRPFPAWTVLVDIKDDGTFLCSPKNTELIQLRKEIIEALDKAEIV